MEIDVGPLDKGGVLFAEPKDKQTDIYTTTERRIGTWIDGKPLYSKVINFGALPNKTVNQ